MKRILLILLSCLFLCGCHISVKEKNLDLEQIKLGNNYSISGLFFLGCGGINGVVENYYYFYTNENGAIRLRKVSYDRVTIYFTEGKPTAHFKATSSLYNIEDQNEWTIDCIMKNVYNYTWDIYIPKGSIVNNYDVNIK